MNHLRIKELLKEKGLTSKELAAEFGITENGLSLVINGKRQPRFELLEKLAARLNVELWQLFTGTGSISNGYVSGLNGFIEYQGIIHRIQSKEDLVKLIGLVIE